MTIGTSVTHISKDFGVGTITSESFRSIGYGVTSIMVRFGSYIQSYSYPVENLVVVAWTSSDHFTSEFRSECRVREAALEYHLSVSSFRAGKITADQHRAENRRIRKPLTENEWEKAKFRVLNQL